MLVYVRWNNGVNHTIAQASSKDDLYDLLDESGPGEEARYKILRGKRFAFEFSAKTEDAHTSEPFQTVDQCWSEEYESTAMLLAYCLELADKDLQDGREFFGLGPEVPCVWCEQMGAQGFCPDHGIPGVKLTAKAE